MLRACVLAVSFFLTACVPVWQEKPAEITSGEALFWNSRLPQLQKLRNWEIQGRAVITQEHEGWNVGLIWLEHDGLFQVKLQGPFAQGGAIITGSDNKVTMTLDDGRVFNSSSADILLKEVLNITLPLDALRDWVRGMPYSQQSYDSIDYDDQGRILAIQQQGWQIDIKRYIPFEHYSMPAKIFIKNQERSLRLVILDWDRTTLEQALKWGSK